MGNTEKKEVFEFLQKTEIHKKNNEVFAVIKKDQFKHFRDVAKSFFYKRLTIEHLKSFLNGDYLELPIDSLLKAYEIDEEFLGISND